MSAPAPVSSHAYGIGVIAVIVGLSAFAVFYTSFYLPESLAKPSVPHEILEPEHDTVIEIVAGALIEGNENYVPNAATVQLSANNRVIWENNDDTAHTVTPDHRYTDPYSQEFGSDGVIMPGESYEFLFTAEVEELHYHCVPHPWMEATIKVEKSRF